MTNNDDRARIPLEKHYTSEVLLRHARLVVLRHAGIGHFSYGSETDDRPLASDKIYLEMNDGQPRFTPTWQRTNYKESIVEDLSICLAEGKRSLDLIIEDRGNDLYTQIFSLENSELDIIRKYNVEKHEVEIWAGNIGAQFSPNSFFNLLDSKIPR